MTAPSLLLVCKVIGAILWLIIIFTVVAVLFYYWDDMNGDN
jgi:hypothetical protein